MRKRHWVRKEHVTVALLVLGMLLGGCSAMANLRDSARNSYQAQRAYEAGLGRYQARDYAGAIVQLQRAVELDPRFDDAEARLAWAYYHLGKYDPAIKHFRQSLARQPQWSGLYDGLGWSLYDSGRYQPALDAFRQAVKLEPDYRDANVGLAYTLFALERYPEALPYLERVTREGEPNALRSASPDLEQVRSRYAWTLFYVKDYQRAREQFTKGVAARPDWAGLHNGLGWSQLRLGDRQRAREHFERALKLRPDFADAKEGLIEAQQAKK